MKQKEFYGVNIKIWLTLVLSATVSAILVIPYSSEITGTPFPPLSEILSIIPIGFIQFGLYAFLGLLISAKIGLEPTPVLAGKAKIGDNLRLSVILGIVAGLGILVLDWLIKSMFTLPLKEGVSLETVTPGPLVAFLASFYGGIGEELALRLFFVPLFCLIIIGAMKLLGYAKTWMHTDNVVWTSIILASVIFGLGHLPATEAVMYITPLVVFRAVLLNGIGGLIFGWLFYRKGLEFAMISHFSADLVLHVLPPLVGYAI